jgi:ABC-type transport system involved in multi-copper enzyme maturation permease subunit
MIRAALIVAALTFHEARRRRLLWVVLVLGGAFLLCFGTGLHFIAAEIRSQAHRGPAGADKMALNFIVMAALYAVNFLIVMVSVLVPIETLSGEIASGAIETLATKPVPRAAIVIGKWLGCWGLVAMYVALLAGGVLLVSKVVGRFTPPGIGIGLPLMLLEAGVLLTISMAAGTRLAGLSNGATAFGLYGLAFLGGWIEQAGTILGNAAARYIGILASLLVPSESLWQLAAYHMQHPLMRDLQMTPFSPASVPSLSMVGWACGYIALVLALTVRLFGRRDL